MKKSIYALFVLFPLVSGCDQSVDATTAYNVAGTYQLIEYVSATVSDDNPSGTITAVQVDEQHVNMVVKGTSGKVKISYSYANVLVSSNGSSQGEDRYSLLYKGRQIGTAGNDAISRYLNLTPSATIRLESVEL